MQDDPGAKTSSLLLIFFFLFLFILYFFCGNIVSWVPECTFSKTWRVALFKRNCLSLDVPHQWVEMTVRCLSSQCFITQPGNNPGCVPCQEGTHLCSMLGEDDAGSDAFTSLCVS